MWVVLGKAGVEEYRLQRKAETDGLDDFRDGAAFHDSDKVLKAVTDMHERLDGQSMKWDHVTRKVLSEMVASMLEVVPDGRPMATVLEKTSQRILKNARKNIQSTPGTSNGVGTNPAESAGKIPPEGGYQARPDIPPPFFSDSQVAGLQLTSLEKVSQHQRAATISVPGTSQEADQSPPPSPANEERIHDRAFVDEPLAYDHETPSYSNRNSPAPGQVDTSPTVKKSNGTRTPPHHGMESPRLKHQRNLAGSHPSRLSTPEGHALNSSPQWERLQGLHLETPRRTAAPGVSATSPDRPLGFHDSAKPRPPRLSFDQAVKYKAEHKEAAHSLNPFSRKDLPSLPHEGYLNDLNNRDHVSKVSMCTLSH